MTTREAVLERLRSAMGGRTSGEELAAALGVSRVAVGKHIHALQLQGYEIEAVPGQGYTLRSIPDEPVPREVERLLQPGFWTHITGGGETGSTNDDCRALARAGASEGTVVLASRQTAGRGRLGRTWESPRGGVYISVLLRPSVVPAEVASLALAVALGVAEGLESLGAAPSLKWPNDVLLESGKVAGVLLEMEAEPDRVDWVVAGIGVNVRRSGPSGSDAPSAAFVRDVATAPVPEVAAAILNGIATAYRAWSKGGFAAIRDAYSSRLQLVGRTVRVRGLDGVTRAEGIVRGVDDQGRLLVENDEGTSAIAAGEVTLRA